MAKPLGGDIEMLGVRPSVTNLVSAITSDPVMHPTIALDEIEDE